jgi:Organic solute transporter Ostalpha
MCTVVPHADNSFSIALYGLILFYDLTKEELTGRRPLAKFLSIKLVVIFTFYQSFVACSPQSISAVPH